MSTTGDSEVLLRVLGDSPSAIAAVRSWSAATQAASRQALGSLRSTSQEATLQAQQMFAQMGAAEQQFTLQVTRGSELVMSAFNRELEAHRKLSEGLRSAYQQALKELASYLAKEAELKGAEQIAMAVADFATFNFAGGAEHLAAAAAWEALGAGISVGAGAIAGGGQTRGRSSYGAGAGGYGSGRSRSNSTGSEGSPAGGYDAQGGAGVGSALATGAMAPAQPSGGLTVSIMGDEEAGQWLATTLNKAVTQSGVQLVSSGSQRGAPVGH